MRWPWVSRRRLEELESDFELVRGWAWRAAAQAEELNQREDMKGFCNDALMIASLMDGMVRRRRAHRDRMADVADDPWEYQDEFMNHAEEHLA